MASDEKIRPKPVLLELRVALSDGSFDTSVQFPPETAKAQADSLVGAWFKLIEAALEVAKEKV